MAKWVPAVLLLFGVAISGCPRRDQPPVSAYDPELLAAARDVAEAEAQEQQETQGNPAEEKKGECSREVGGCKSGYLCWDSWYCKIGFNEQCSAAGDKRCHQRCSDDSDCPKDMPRCVRKPIFSGSDRGVLERFCVAEDQ